MAVWWHDFLHAAVMRVWESGDREREDREREREREMDNGDTCVCPSVGVSRRG